MARPRHGDSQVAKHEGLVFRLLNKHGEKVGTPINASLFYGKPTLKNLKLMFADKKIKKVALRSRLKTAIDMALLSDKISLADLAAALKKEGIDMVIRENEDGIIYGITYVDHRFNQKAIFNGSELGKGYSAKVIFERCAYT